MDKDEFYTSKKIQIKCIKHNNKTKPHPSCGKKYQTKIYCIAPGFSAIMAIDRVKVSDRLRCMVPWLVLRYSVYLCVWGRIMSLAMYVRPGILVFLPFKDLRRANPLLRNQGSFVLSTKIFQCIVMF